MHRREADTTAQRGASSVLARARRGMLAVGLGVVCAFAASGAPPRAVASAAVGAAFALAEFEGVRWSVARLLAAISAVSWVAWFLQVARLGVFGAVLYFLVVRRHWPVGPMLFGFGALPLGLAATALWMALRRGVARTQPPLAPPADG